MSLVLDASVAAKWLLPEADSPRTLKLFDEWERGEIDLIAPSLLPAEVGNALWKRVSQGHLTGEKASLLFQDFSHLQIPLVPIDQLAESALALALRHRHPIYDCLYVALAAETGSELVTADEKLFRVFNPDYPRVHLLRDWA